MDGRDAFLTCLVAENDGDAERVWELFAAHTDLTRPKRDGRKPWSREDAEDKAKLPQAPEASGACRGRSWPSPDNV